MNPLNWTNRYFRYYRGFNKAVWLNVFAVLVNTFGFITGSFFILYLVKDKGLTVETASLFMSLGAIGSILGSYFGGWMADRFPPVKIAQACLFLFAVGLLTFPFLNIPSTIFVMLVIVNFLYSAFRPINNLILMAHSSVIDRPRVMGLFRMAFNLGLAFSMGIGGFLAEHNFAWYFYFASFMSFLATILFIRFEKSMALPPAWAPKDSLDSAKFSAWRIFQNRPFMLLSLIYLGYCLVYFQVRVTFALYITQTYRLSLIDFGILYVINSLMVVFLEVPLMDTLKRRSQMNVCIAGLLLIGIGLGMLPLGHGMLYASISTMIWSFGEILTSSPFYVLVMEYANPKARGTYMGFFQSVMSVATILFPLIGGFLYSIDHGRILWFGCFFASLLLILSFTKLKKVKPQL